MIYIEKGGCCVIAYNPFQFLVVALAGVAQLVEQLICNQQVAGSSPFASSFSFCDELKFGGMPEWSKGAGCKPAGFAYVGSNPTSPTIHSETSRKRE